MSPTSKSKSKDKRTGKEQKGSSKASGIVNAASGIPASAYNPFHTLDTSSTSSAPALHVNGHFRNIDESDDHSGSTNGSGADYDSASNNDSRSVESEEHKEKPPSLPTQQETIPGADNDKREKIRQKNERKHQRQKERRAQELHERCSGYLMSRKLEALAQSLVGMGFSAERATMALILNEGRMEEAVAWLLEGGEADAQTDQSLDTGGNLKIDISNELARIGEMETIFKCSKQEVERAVVACEGDLDKAKDTLLAQKQDPPSALLKSEETTDPSSVSNGKISLAFNRSSVRPQPKASSTSLLQQGRDEKDFNYTKTVVKVGSVQKSVNKNVQQPLTRIPPKLDWTRPQPMGATTEKRWPVGGSSPSVSYSLASPLQVSPPPAKTDSRYVSLGSEYKTPPPGTIREPVVVMQRPQSVNAKQASVSSLSSSPPGAAAGWYPPTSSEIMNPNGLLPHIPSSRSLSPSNLSPSQFYQQPHPQQQQQLISVGSSLDAAGSSRSNASWSRMGTSPTLAAASSLGLFSGLGSTCSSGSNSPVDWNTGGSIPCCDYTNIDWSLDRGALSSKPDDLWLGLGPFSKSNPHIYDSNALVMGLKPAVRPPSSHGSGISIAGLQDSEAVSADTSAAGSCEWASPFEGKDLFSIPRQFVSSPSL